MFQTRVFTTSCIMLQVANERCLRRLFEFPSGPTLVTRQSGLSDGFVVNHDILLDIGKKACVKISYWLNFEQNFH